MSKHRNMQQWLELITECRQSGMSDMDWCRANGISRSTFYKALLRLQNAACELPKSSAATSTEINLTSSKQDIVPVSIIHDTCSEVNNTMSEPAPYVMEITKCDMTIKVSNDISASLLSRTLQLLGGVL